MKETISFEDFEKIDVRVGTIVEVRDIEDSRSLVQLIVSFGDEQRSILAGMKGERADLERKSSTKQALFVVNLEPRQMMGRMSEGMLFDIGYADGITPVLAVPEKPVPDGTRVG
ncbi:MAG: hypothetical protein R2849_03020 [Thermomicrobiales bacterium]